MDDCRDYVLTRKYLCFPLLFCVLGSFFEALGAEGVRPSKPMDDCSDYVLTRKYLCFPLCLFVSWGPFLKLLGSLGASWDLPGEPCMHACMHALGGLFVFLIDFGIDFGPKRCPKKLPKRSPKRPKIAIKI